MRRERLVVRAPAGSELVVDETGSGLEPLVWLHSEFGPFDDPPLTAEVLDQIRCLSVHLPGWGVSSRLEEVTSLPDLALALWWLLDELAIERALLVGHGIGGTIALELAIQQPQRAAAVVAAAPFGSVDANDPGVDIFALLPSHLLPHLYVDPRGGVAAAHFPTPASPHEKGLAAIRRVEVLGEAGRYLFPLPDTGIRDRLYRLSHVDVELLWGEHDGVVPPQTAEQWALALPSARSSVVPATAHMLPYESDVLSRTVLALLEHEAVAS